jgi:hypothetical protein
LYDLRETAALRLLVHIAFFLHVTRYRRRIGIGGVGEGGKSVLPGHTGRKTGSYHCLAYGGLFAAQDLYMALDMGPDFFGNLIIFQDAFNNSVGNGKIIAPIIVKLE